MNRRLRLLAGVGALLTVTLTACGSGDGSASGGTDGGPTVEIVTPADGAAITVPFTLTVDSSEELGTTESGRHHVHLFFDGDDSKYEVVESDTIEVAADSPALAGLAPGEHVLNISLHNADHSPAGAEAQITLNVGGDPPPDGETTSDEPSYDY